MGSYPLLPPNNNKVKPVLRLTLNDGQFGVFQFNMKIYGYKWFNTDFTVIFNPNPLKFEGYGNLFEITMQLYETMNVIITSNQIQNKLTLWNDNDNPIFLKPPKYPINQTQSVDIPIYTRLITPPPISRKLESDNGLGDIGSITRHFASF